MALQVERTADTHLLRFGPELNIFTVKEDFESLQCLQHEAIFKLMLDLSQIGDFDSAGLQLLLWIRAHPPTAQPIQWLGLDNEVISKVTSLFRLSLSQDTELPSKEL